MKKSCLDRDAIAVNESEPAFLLCEGSQANLGYFLLDTLLKVSLIQKEFWVRKKKVKNKDRNNKCDLRCHSPWERKKSKNLEAWLYFKQITIS